jgi:hypothetical protein
MLVTIPKTLFCRDYDKLAVTTVTAVPLTAAKVVKSGVPCQLVEIIVEGNDVRRRNDGSAPTTGATGDGAPMYDKSGLILAGGSAIKNLQFISISGNATVHVHYYYEK